MSAAKAATGAIQETLAVSPAPDTGSPKVPRPREEAQATIPDLTSPFPVIPGYVLIKELGRGGMGVVYKAREVSLGRTVALKMVLAGVHASSEDHQRFRAEAEVLARLQHPNLVQIYGIGEQEGTPYFSLEFVEGGDLDLKLQGKPQPPEAAARLTETLARAVHVAHQHNIVHRDLKPANVLLTADGTPKITDFGLAKQMDSNQAGTRTGAIMGTPSYMSPEQAAGRGRDIGPHTDVWALGAMLYEFLTGRPPFLADSGWDTVLQVVNEEPVPPRKLQHKLSRDLETICLKCLEKEPRKRYPTALALAEDLERFLRHEPIQARPTGPLERMGKWARRRPAAALAAAVGLLSVVTILALGAAYHLHLQKVNEDNRRGVVRLSVIQGSQRLHAGDGFGALVWYTHALDTERGDANREATHRDRIAATLRGCPKLAGFWLHDDSIIHGSFSPDGKSMVTACADNQARVFDVDGGARRAVLAHNDDVVEAWFSPEGTRVLTASRDKTARLWDAGTGKALTPPMLHGAVLRCAYFSPDGRRVITAGNDRRARIWDAASGMESGPPLVHGKFIQWATFSADGKRMATAGEDHVARVWDAESRQELFKLPHQGNVTHVAFSPDGEYLVSSSDDQTARLWRIGAGVAEDRRMVASLPHNDVVKWGAFSPDGKRVLTVSDDKSARVWSVTDGRLMLPPLMHGSNVRRYAAFSADGCMIFTSSDDNTGRVWQAHDGQPYTTHLPHNGTVHCIAGSPDGHRVLTVGDDRTACLWDLATGSLLTSVEQDRADAGAVRVTVSPDGIRTARIQGWEVEIVNTSSGIALTPPLKHDERVFAAVFSADGRWLATASQDGSARIWDGFTGKPRLSSSDGQPILLRHASLVNGVAFSPDGKRVVTSGGDNTARIWDAASGVLLTQPLSHQGSVNSAAFSPDGRRVVTAGSDRVARVWDAATGLPLTPPLEHRRAVRDAWFSDDGRSVISVSVGGRRTWKLPRETRDPTLLLELSELLASYRVEGRSDYMPLGAAGQAQLWGRLGGTVPELSVATADELQDWNRRRAADCQETGEWFGARWHLDRLIERDASAWRERLRRGDALAELGRYPAALADYVSAAGHAAARADVQSRLALLYLHNHQTPAYDRVCKTMLKAPEHDHEALCQALWTSNLSAEGSIDRALVVQLAERFAAEQPKDGRAVGALGAAFYRAGRHEDAVRRLTQSIDMLSGDESREACVFLALAQQQLGKKDEARHWLRRAGDRDRGELHATTWPHRLALQWLTCEGEAALGNATP